MESFTVSFDVRTKAMDLEELSRRLGVYPSKYSYEKGQAYPVPIKRLNLVRYAYTWWRLESSAGRKASLQRHLRSVFLKLPKLKLRNRKLLPKDCQLCLRIGVFFDTQMNSIEIPVRYLTCISRLNAGIEVSFYSCYFESTQRRKKGKPPNQKSLPMPPPSGKAVTVSSRITKKS